jgi:prephenate dehydrogenase
MNCPSPHSTGLPAKSLASLQITIVGLGLMGGSLARCLKDKAKVVGYDPDEKVTQQAEEAGVVVSRDLGEALKGTDIVFCAAPLGQMASCLEEVGTILGASALDPSLGAPENPVGRRAVVSDIASVKLPFVKAQLQGVPDEVSLVPGHPMAGSEKGGFEHSSEKLLKNAPWALCLDDVDLASWAEVAKVVLATGAWVVPCLAAEHDLAVALTSHLPHVTANGLVSLASKAPGIHGLVSSLQGGSWLGATRVASSPSQAVLSMCWENRRELSSWLESFLEELGQVQELLKAQDPRGFAQWLSASSSSAALIQRVGTTREKTPLLPRESTREDSRRWLLELGRRGGRVVEVAWETDEAGEPVLVVTSEEDEVTKAEP